MNPDQNIEPTPTSSESFDDAYSLPRITDPDIEWSDGSKTWPLNGRIFSDPSDFCDAVNISGTEKNNLFTEMGLITGNHVIIHTYAINLGA